MSMRIAIISDIHGNLIALEAALADIIRERPDQIVCLGDVAAHRSGSGEAGFGEGIAVAATARR